MSYSIRTREDLDRYLVAFNTTEPEIYTSYYAPDAEMALGNLVLNGRDAIIQFFNIGRPRVSEHIAADSVLFEKHAVALTATITFTAKVDLTEGFMDIGPPVTAGGGYITKFAIYYEIDENGKFSKLYAGRVKPATVFRAGKL